ncbi:MAG: zinc ABC transporter substrate-binding protein, partial [Rubrivivax sp.]
MSALLALRRPLAFLMAGLLVAALSDPGLPTASAQTALPRLRVVASFSVLADMVREVGGDAVEITALVGPDADAHVFEPSPADVQRVARADLVVVNGFGFEGWIERLIRSSGYRGRVVVASQGIQPRRVDGVADPHAWQSLVLAQRYVDNLRAALVAARPAQAAHFDARATDYQRRIVALHQSISPSFSTDTDSTAKSLIHI